MIYIRDYSILLPLTPAEIARLADRCRIDDNECWIWTGTRRSDGYGQVFLRGGLWRPHRLLYELLIGHAPEDKVLDHLCRVTLCCNPFHLQSVYQRTNVCRGNVHSGEDHYNGARTHCIHGHPLSGDNVYSYTIGGHRHRVCRACARRATAAYRRRKRDAARSAVNRRGGAPYPPLLESPNALVPAVPDRHSDSLIHLPPALADVLGNCSDSTP